MTVIIEPMGGLGNQLFVYAAGRAQAVREETSLYVDPRNYLNNPSRSFELDSFISNFLEVEPCPRSFQMLLSRVRGLRLLLRQGFLKTFFRRIATVESAFLFVAPEASKCRVTRLRGYFQSWRYFGNLSHELRSEIRDIATPSDWFQEMSASVLAAGTTVGIHVRRGDYVTNPHMGVVPERYYESALRILQNLVGDFRIYVFSDDIDSLSTSSFLWPWRESMIFVYPSRGSRPIESLNLLGQCGHVVMANSSFSWWGAWLGEGSERYVFYPRPWLAGAYVDDRDLVLPHWISLGTEAS